MVYWGSGGWKWLSVWRLFYYEHGSISCLANAIDSRLWGDWVLQVQAWQNLSIFRVSKYFCSNHDVWQVIKKTQWHFFFSFFLVPSSNTENYTSNHHFCASREAKTKAAVVSPDSLVLVSRRCNKWHEGLMHSDCELQTFICDFFSWFITFHKINLRMPDMIEKILNERLLFVSLWAPTKPVAYTFCIKLMKKCVVVASVTVASWLAWRDRDVDLASNPGPYHFDQEYIRTHTVILEILVS